MLELEKENHSRNTKKKNLQKTRGSFLCVHFKKGYLIEQLGKFKWDDSGDIHGAHKIFQNISTEWVGGLLTDVNDLLVA